MFSTRGISLGSIFDVRLSEVVPLPGDWDYLLTSYFGLVYPIWPGFFPWFLPPFFSLFLPDRVWLMETPFWRFFHQGCRRQSPFESYCARFFWAVSHFLDTSGLHKPFLVRGEIRESFLGYAFPHCVPGNFPPMGVCPIKSMGC